MSYLIIGVGPAGITAAEQLRRLQAESVITVLGDAPEAPYARMALPYLLTGRVGETGTHLRKEPGHYQRLGLTLLQGRAMRLDSQAKTLALADGQILAYDRLLIACGASPIWPEIPGIRTLGVLHCWTLADARAIAGRVVEGSRVLLLGAGFIGCIVLEALVRRGAQVSVVEAGERMVPRMLDATAGGLLRAWCENKGVAVYTSAQVTAVEGNAADSTSRESSCRHGPPTSMTGALARPATSLSMGSGIPPAVHDRGRLCRNDGSEVAPKSTALIVRLADGTLLAADTLVCAVGVKPNIAWLQDSGLDMDQGLLVNRHLQTSAADVYAAGDVAQGLDFSSGGYSVQAIQPTAVEHGRIAAFNMAGRCEIVHRGSLNMNVLDTLGLVTASFGQWQGVDGGDSAELVDSAGYRYLKLQFQEDVLVGAQSVGHTDHLGVLRGLIQSRVKLGAWKGTLRRDPSRLMEAYLACTLSIATLTA